MNVADIFLEHVQLDVPLERTDPLGQRLDIHPRNGVLLALRRNPVGKLLQSHPAQQSLSAEIDLAYIQFVMLEIQFNVINDLDFVVVHVEDLLVQDVRSQQNRAVSRMALQGINNDG